MFNCKRTVSTSVRHISSRSLQQGRISPALQLFHHFSNFNVNCLLFKHWKLLQFLAVDSLAARLRESELFGALGSAHGGDPASRAAVF